MSDHGNIIAKTKTWIEKWVIALDLCPFASHPFQRDLIRYTVVGYDDLERFLETFYKECMDLAQTDSSNLSTSVIILPQGVDDFLDYLDLYETCITVLRDTDLDQYIQLASFHPKYQFAETTEEDVTNYTNRSPYPLIHLLKVDEVERAVENYDVDSIPENNINKMQDLGSEDISEILDNL